MPVVKELIIAGYVFRCIFCLLGCVLAAFVIALHLKASLLMMTGDAFVRAVSQVSKSQFGYSKMGFDNTDEQDLHGRKESKMTTSKKDPAISNSSSFFTVQPTLQI